MRRNLLVFFMLFILIAGTNALCEKHPDNSSDCIGKAGGYTGLAEIYSFVYQFHGPDYIYLKFEVKDKFPETAEMNLTYFVDFSFNPNASNNETGEWKPDGTIALRPYDKPNKFKAEGEFGGVTFALSTVYMKDNVITFDLTTYGMRSDWFARSRVRSQLKEGENTATDEVENIWMFPDSLERADGTVMTDPGPEDVIDIKEDEMGKILVGMFEFTFGDQRGVFEIKRHSGKYYCTFAWYSGQVTYAPLYISKVNMLPERKRRKGNSILSIDLFFKTHYGHTFHTDRPKPAVFYFPGFTELKASTGIFSDKMTYEVGFLQSEREKVDFSYRRIDRKPLILPDRREYLDRLVKEKFISSAEEAYKEAYSLFSSIASEDWTPGLQLSKIGGFENKQYIARRMFRLAGMIDHFTDCDQGLRERALQLRWKIFTNKAVEPVLANTDVGVATRVPILVYIFPKTEAALDARYTMKAEFSTTEIQKIRRGLINGGELLFQETRGYFTPHFTFYSDTKDAKELPPCDKLGRDLIPTANPNAPNEYFLQLQSMMQYTTYVNEYTSSTDYLDPEEYEKKGYNFPIIFLIGKVDSGSFKNMLKTRSQSEKDLAGATVVTGVSYTKGFDRGRQAFCHIVLDKNFKEKDLLEIVHWATVMIMLDNIYIMKRNFKMRFLEQGLEIFPDPYKDIKMFNCTVGSMEWWNAFLNVYWTEGFRKIFSYGRRPFYLNQAMQYPQILGDKMKLGHYDTWLYLKNTLGK